MIRRAFSPLALLLSIAFFSANAPISAGDDDDGGPIVLMGIDAEDHWRTSDNGTEAGQHGPIENYVLVVQSVLAKVTNERTGILIIGGGKSPTDDVTTFWQHIAADVGQPVTFLNGAAAIRNFSFSNHAMIAIASDALNTASGGLTEDENDALTQRHSDIARFINRGGGLVGFSSGFTFSDPYGYLDSLGEFEIAANLGAGYSDILPIGDGPELGITDALDVCCWHDVFEKFPSFLKVLALDAEVTLRPAALGGTAVFVPPPDRGGPSATGYMKLGGGQIAATGVRHWFHLGCSPVSRSTLERLNVRWGNNSFHLEEMLTATCTKESSNTRNRGKGAFNTHIGTGTGRVSNTPGVYTVEWRFFDGGDRNRDTATIIIRNLAGAIVVNASGPLSNGDQQAFEKNR